MTFPIRRASEELDEATFVAIRRLVQDKSGIYLRGDKRNLVTTRLSRRMRELGVTSYRAYLRILQDDDGGAELTALLDAISTNVTSFFREPSHFDLVRDAYLDWRRAGQLRYRFWSAACSSGEEPYSLAITLLDAGTIGVDVRILATDISTRVLGRAMNGRYSSTVVEPVPERARAKYFSYEHGEFVVSSALRAMVMFRQANLSVLPTPVRAPIDVVLCRNVMIYFEDSLRRALVNEFSRVLRPGGYLLVGHSESLVGMQTGLEVVKPSVYRKPEHGS